MSKGHGGFKKSVISLSLSNENRRHKYAKPRKLHYLKNKAIESLRLCPKRPHTLSRDRNTETIQFHR